MSTNTEQITEWFTRNVGDWTIDEVTDDADEILVVLDIGEPELAGEVSDEERTAARKARIGAFRGETRGRRMEIAAAAQTRFGRKVSWGSAPAGVAACSPTWRFRR